MTSKVSAIKRLPPPGSRYANYDFITLPLLHDPLDEMDEPGAELRRGNGHLIVAGCTWKGEEYLKSSEREIVVLNMGVGQIGSGSSEEDFGTAGMSQGLS